MTKSNNEWVPEAGDEVEVWVENAKYWAKVKVLVVDCGRVVWRNGSDGLSYIGTPLEYVRPIKTEAEKRREEMFDRLSGVYINPGEYVGRQYAEAIVDAGWIKPKQLTVDVIESLIDKHQNDCETLCSFEFARMIEAYIYGEIS